MHRLVILLALVALVAGAASAPAGLAAPKGRVAREPQAPRGMKADPDRYIVVLRDDLVSANAAETAAVLGRENGADVTEVYDIALKGFAARIPAARVARLRQDPRVALVEPDQIVRIAADELVTGVDRIGADREVEGQVPAQAGKPVAVIDTGIAKHPDLNVKGGYNCTSSRRTAWGDGNGHGTHVAGTVGAKKNDAGVIGVAPGTPLWAVKVLGSDGSGYTSWVICGINWAAKNAAAKGIKVANMSLGGTPLAADHPTKCNTTARHIAICKLANAGVRIVVSAGNDGKDASTKVPAMYSQVTTVSALADTDGCAGGHGPEFVGQPSGRIYVDDSLAHFSNYGAVVDVAAPGLNIKSTWKGGGYNTISGTSMATPHVAAAFALGWDGVTKEAGPIANDYDGFDEGIVNLSVHTACDEVPPPVSPTSRDTETASRGGRAGADREAGGARRR